MVEVRLVEVGDVAHLKGVLDSIELFPSEMLGEMIAPYFEDAETDDVWFTAMEGGVPVSIGYCAPEKLTDGTFNLYAIGVRRDMHRKGVARGMMQFIESYLAKKGARILIVDTSGTADFSGVRRFYEEVGYVKEAVVRDFWSDGDDKVVFWKRLNEGSGGG